MQSSTRSSIRHICRTCPPSVWRTCPSEFTRRRRGRFIGTPTHQKDQQSFYQTVFAQSTSDSAPPRQSTSITGRRNLRCCGLLTLGRMVRPSLFVRHGCSSDLSFPRSTCLASAPVAEAFTVFSPATCPPQADLLRGPSPQSSLCGFVSWLNAYPAKLVPSVVEGARIYSLSQKFTTNITHNHDGLLTRYLCVDDSTPVRGNCA